MDNRSNSPVNILGPYEDLPRGRLEPGQTRTVQLHTGTVPVFRVVSDGQVIITLTCEAPRRGTTADVQWDGQKLKCVGGSHSTSNATAQPPPAAPSANATSAKQVASKKWVLSQTIVNPLNVPLYNGQTAAFGTKIIPMDEIVTGRGIKQTVNESIITEEYKSVSVGKVQYDWKFEFTFDRPPTELHVGDTINLKASGKATGTGNADEGVGSIFYYASFGFPHPEGATAVFSNALVVVDSVAGGHGTVRSKPIGLQPSKGITEGSIAVQMKFPEYLQNSSAFTISAVSTTDGLWVDWVYRLVAEPPR